MIQCGYLRSHFLWIIKLFIGRGRLPVTVTSRNITWLAGYTCKPAFPTVTGRGHTHKLFTAIAPTLELQGPCISIDVEGASSLVAVNYARCKCLKWHSNRPDHQTVVKWWPIWFIRIHQQLTLEMRIPQFLTCSHFPKPIAKIPHSPKKILPFLVVVCSCRCASANLSRVGNWDPIPFALCNSWNLQLSPTSGP